MALSEKVIADKLRNLQDTQEGISTTSQWFIFHKRHANTCTQVWDREIRKLTGSRALSFLYLANDIIQNSKKRGSEYLHSFSKLLPGAIEHAYKRSPPDIQSRIMRLLNIWQDRGVYGRDYLENLRKRCERTQRTTREPSAIKKPPPDVDEGKLTSQLQQLDTLINTRLVAANEANVLWERLVIEKTTGTDMAEAAVSYQNLLEKSVQHKGEILELLKSIMQPLRWSMEKETQMVSDIKAGNFNFVPATASLKTQDTSLTTYPPTSVSSLPSAPASADAFDTLQELPSSHLLADFDFTSGDLQAPDMSFDDAIHATFNGQEYDATAEVRSNKLQRT